MAELQERDAKLIQYLNEAYGKEKELETSLQAHIRMTSRDTYKRRLKDHLKETKQQSKGLQRRIKQLGGKAEATSVALPGPEAMADAAGAVTSIANKAVAAAKGPLHAVRGTSEPEKMLKNAKTEYWNEAEEIANYNAIETLAEALGDRETAKLARDYRRQEERMAKFLEKTIPQLTREVVKAEIPASQRNGGRSPRRGGTRSGSSARTTSSRTATASGATKAATAGRSSKAATTGRAKAATAAKGPSRARKTAASAPAAAASEPSAAAGRPGGSSASKPSSGSGKSAAARKSARARRS